MTKRILFVCLGNICRSPTAEAVARSKAAAAGLPIEFDSAGTGDWHIGKPPYGPMQQAARLRGYDLSSLRARQVCAQDFDSFDLIVAMDAANRSDLLSLNPEGRVALMTDYADIQAHGVPDPYFTRDFNGALDLIERCTDGLLAQL
jgi:protein-tyrosine phosphatase